METALVVSIVLGLVEGGAKAAALLAQGKIEDAKNTALGTIDEANAKRLAHEKKHAERDADIRGGLSPTPVSFDTTDVIKGSSER